MGLYMAKTGGEYAAVCLVVLLTTAVAGTVAVFLARSLTRPLGVLVEEAGRLTAAVADGKLDERADPDHVGAELAPILSGLNAILDTFVGTFRMSVERVRGFGEGRVPDRVDAKLRGEFAETGRGWNHLIDIIAQRNADTELLFRAAMEGRLDVRADTSKYTGYNGKLLEKINAMMDALVAPLKVAAATVAQISRGEIPPHITAEY